MCVCVCVCVCVCETGGAGPRPGALQRGRLCGHGKQRGKCRECRGEDGGEAMGGEASGRGAREDRRAAQQPAEAQPAAAARAVRKKCPHGRQRSKCTVRGQQHLRAQAAAEHVQGLRGREHLPA